MGKIKELLASRHIQIALATAASILSMAFVSKRVLSEPMGFVPTAIPPFIGLIFETAYPRFHESRLFKTGYWVAAILFSTALIVVIYLIEDA